VKNNQMMQVAGQSLAKKTEALIKEYHRQSNIQQTIDVLSQAFPGRIFLVFEKKRLSDMTFISLEKIYRKRVISTL